ncbi:hypothetical protein L6E12_29440 [Actinokineospora sp. PR83]|nr:hypothetical protein [Actinokineospora sp. PR83]MCG8919901.1 hypothetical protein [Actinokineospora sp. PR83]
MSVRADRVAVRGVEPLTVLSIPLACGWRRFMSAVKASGPEDDRVA